MKHKILIVAFYMPATGFNRVMQHIMEGIKEEGYEIHYFGVGYDGEVIQKEDLTIYPYMGNAYDRNGFVQLRRLGEKIQPDTIFLLHDLKYQREYLFALEGLLGKSKIMTYTPLDGKIVNGDNWNLLKQIDKCVLYTHFAKEEISSLIQSGENGRLGNLTTEFEVIPHGVDTPTFYPLYPFDKNGFNRKNKLAAKKQLFPSIPDLDNAFIVLNANQVGPRKRLDLTIKGFALFAEDKPENVKLYLHFPSISRGRMHSLMKIIEEYEIEDRLLLNRDGKGQISPVADQQLNLIYNACDVGVNTAMGEGWGLVSLEHAACGTPQILPRHSALTEIWKGAADFLEPTENKVPWFSEFEMSNISAEDLAAKLERLYCDEQHWKKMAMAGYQRATEPQFEWASISRQWSAVFKAFTAQQAALV